MARPRQTTSLSPSGEIRVPPSFYLQSTNPDQLGSTSTRTNTPFTQNLMVIRSITGTITPWSAQLFSTIGNFKAEFIHRAESTNIQLLDRVPG